jgi:60 kDa SS-A/Ro ribonucleoprotein
MVDTYLDALKTPYRPLRDGEAATHEGGIAHSIDTWSRLNRFLILGSEGSFYQSGRDLTIENVASVKECLAEDYERALDIILEISEAGRAPKNDPAILALAIATLDPFTEVRRLAFHRLSRICRTGTHLLHFAAYRKALGGGWGRGMRTSIGKWFTEKDTKDLAYQAVKYPSRDNWALSDLLRLAHPQMDEDHSAIAKWIVDREYDGDNPAILGWQRLHENEEFRENYVAKIITEYGLPREAVPNKYLNSPDVWEALLQDMPMTAMIRNLNKMTMVGLMNESSALRTVIDRLGDQERIRKARVHPIALLAAIKTYEQGKGERGKLTWTPVKRIVNALDEAFYLAFGNVPKSGKQMRLSLDVSSSMDGNHVAGMPFLSAREASAAMALVTKAVEGDDAHFLAYSHQLVEIDIRPSMRLDEVIRTMKRIPYGGTYCSLPIQDALRTGIAIDAFVSYTDSETWNGSRWGYGMYGSQSTEGLQTADEALRDYRERSGIAARHVVCAMTATDFSIANPNDPLQLDIGGFDTATPEVLSMFVAGQV